MNRSSTFLLLGALGTTIVLSSCSFNLGGSGGENSYSESIASSESSVLQTTNVSYIGTIEEIGLTAYQQGTHKLVLDDGQFILLESTDANLTLGNYLGKRVEVHGSVQPTIEAGGTLMRVEVVTLLSAESSSESSVESSGVEMCGGIAGFPCTKPGTVCVDNPNDGCDPLNGGADCGGICVPMLASSSSIATSSISSSKVAASSISRTTASSMAVVSSSAISSSVMSSTASSSSSIEASVAMEAKIALLAKQNYSDSSLWTQKYCTNHIAFCIPVHKNWYFKSFGATTTNLWHVEFSMESIDELYQGPIFLNQAPGLSAAIGASDGEIRTQGSDIVIYKDWTDGTHFEFIGDARLREPISYMANHITAYNPGE